MAKWRKKVPTTEGIYFARIPDGTHDLVIIAEECLFDSDAVATLRFFLGDDDVDPTVFEWWYGPIERMV